MQKLNVKIDGMGCGACVQKATTALKAVPGVEVVSVEVGQAVVQCDINAVSPQAIVDALGKLGFTARPKLAVGQ